MPQDNLQIPFSLIGLPGYIEILSGFPELPRNIDAVPRPWYPSIV
jgi:hypothetical protein